MLSRATMLCTPWCPVDGRHDWWLQLDTDSGKDELASNSNQSLSHGVQKKQQESKKKQKKPHKEVCGDCH